MSTQASREQFIQRALVETTEPQYRVPFRGGLTLPVIEVPLDLPVLNAASLRIAPALEDHPRKGEVLAEPDSDSSQDIVATLVRAAHRNADDLQHSLQNGQHYPGVITRTGKLINANTRCVLLRELYRAGKIQTDRLRVAVLPVAFAAADEVQLESVLQQQREYKDEYNFVAELMMLRTLSQQAGLSDDQIAAQQERGRNGAKEVHELREILDDMERARRLLDPPVPISQFVTNEGQRENWKVIHAKVRAQDKIGSTDGGDEILRNFLLTTYLGLQAVHKGARHIHPEWVHTDLLPALKDSGDELSVEIAEHIQQKAAEPVPRAATPTGVDLLGDPPEDVSTAAVVGSAALALIHQVAARTGESLTLSTGRTVPTDDVAQTLKAAVRRAFDAADRRDAAGSRLDRPVSFLTKARKDLRDASEALAEVVADDEFEPRMSQVRGLVDELKTTLAQIVSLVADDGVDGD